MKQYQIKIPDKDFIFSKLHPVMKGSRAKRMAIVNQCSAIFKYDHPNYNVSEICSEKMSKKRLRLLILNAPVLNLHKMKKEKLEF
jgi:hypothetical protein